MQFFHDYLFTDTLIVLLPVEENGSKVYSVPLVADLLDLSVTSIVMLLMLDPYVPEADGLTFTPDNNFCIAVKYIICIC